MKAIGLFLIYLFLAIAASVDSPSFARILDLWGNESVVQGIISSQGKIYVGIQTNFYAADKLKEIFILEFDLNGQLQSSWQFGSD